MRRRHVEQADRDYLNQVVTLRAERRDDLPDYVVGPPRKMSGLWSGPEATTGDARVRPVRSPVRARCDSSSTLTAIAAVHRGAGAQTCRRCGPSGCRGAMLSGSLISRTAVCCSRAVQRCRPARRSICSSLEKARHLRSCEGHTDRRRERRRSRRQVPACGGVLSRGESARGAATRTDGAGRSPGALAEVLRNALADVESTARSSEVRGAFRVEPPRAPGPAGCADPPDTRDPRSSQRIDLTSQSRNRLGRNRSSR